VEGRTEHESRGAKTNMKFPGLSLLFHKSTEDFNTIVGYDDVKNIIRRTLDSDESFNLLLWGEPASSKTLFLLELAKQKGAVFFDCSNTTSRILDVLEQERPKIILFDELEKMGRFQNQLLNFLESGHIKVDQMKRQYDFTINGAKVFASANDLNKLSPPLRSRFRRLHLPKYSKDKFLEVAVKVCPKLSKDTALLVGEETWKQQGDIRDVISVSKLIRKTDGPTEVDNIIKTLMKYGSEEI
jgi:holliday junction DNA helicase RuvB